MFMQFKKQGVGGAAEDSVHVMFSAEGTMHSTQIRAAAVENSSVNCVPTHLTSVANNMGKYFGKSHNFQN